MKFLLMEMVSGNKKIRNKLKGGKGKKSINSSVNF